MKLIQGLTDQPKQQITIPLDGGTQAVWTLYYRALQQGWFYDMAWNGNTVTQGQRLVASPNILRQLINQIPFGISVLTSGNVEPTSINDLENGVTTFYLLQGDDLSLVEQEAYGAPAGQVQAVALTTSGSSVIVPPASWGPAGGDLRGTYPNPQVGAVHTADGVQLLINLIADGQYLKRSGVQLVGVAPPTGVLYYPTLSALRAAPVPANDTIALLGGYNFDMDGGGGLFVFTTASGLPDDGGTRIVPGGSSPVVDAGGNITTPGTTPTVGFWWRQENMQTYGGAEGRFNVKWFGAVPDNNSDNTPSFRLALAALYYGSGCLYIPAGQWRLSQKWVVDCSLAAKVAMSIIGDGPGATALCFGLTSAADSMIEIKNVANAGCLKDLQITRPGYAGLVTTPKVLWIHDTTSFEVINVQLPGQIAEGSGGGVLFCGAPTNTNLTLLGVTCIGGGGTQFFWGGGSGIITACTFTEGDRGPGPAWASGTNYGPGQYVTDGGLVYMELNVQTPSTVAPHLDATNWQLVPNVNLPCFWINGCNTLQIRGSFFSGGGPWVSFRNSTIANAGSSFTVTTSSAHGMTAGDYCVIRDSTVGAYNGWWKIASVTSTTVTVNATTGGGAATATYSSLWSCMRVSQLTESDMVGCFFSTGGSPGAGSIGVFVDGWAGVSVGEFAISDCICDYGNTAFFLHGRANGDPGDGSSVHAMSLNNCRPNGGPRDPFGCFRFEGCSFITMDGCRAFPGNDSPPATGITFNSVVVCDGGQAYHTQDITITGGIITSANSSGLYPGATIYAFTFDGANVRRISAWNCSVDCISSNANVYQFLNGAGTASGITLGYANQAGRFTLLDSTGVHNL